MRRRPESSDLLRSRQDHDVWCLSQRSFRSSCGGRGPIFTPRGCRIWPPSYQCTHLTSALRVHGAFLVPTPSDLFVASVASNRSASARSCVRPVADVVG